MNTALHLHYHTMYIIVCSHYTAAQLEHTSVTQAIAAAIKAQPTILLTSPGTSFLKGAVAHSAL